MFWLIQFYFRISAAELQKQKMLKINYKPVFTNTIFNLKSTAHFHSILLDSERVVMSLA